MRVVGRAATRLHDLPKPTIAAVNGVAAGAGCNLALGCDLIVASETARFSQIFVQRSLTLDFGGTWILPRLVGLHKAKELAFLGEIISAGEAAEIGIVNRVVAAAELQATVGELAGRLAALPPIPLSMMKMALNQSAHLTLAQAVELEASPRPVNSHADTRRSHAAFVEKREARFTGRLTASAGSPVRPRPRRRGVGWLRRGEVGPTTRSLAPRGARPVARAASQSALHALSSRCAPPRLRTGAAGCMKDPR